MPGKGHFSLLIIPHGENRTREINISRPLLWGVSAAACVCFCALVFYTIGYYLKLYQEVQLSAYQAENADLRDRLAGLMKRSADLQRAVEQLTETDRKMRTWTSLPEPGEDVRQMGVGGAAGAPPWEERVSSEVGELLSRAYTQLDRLSRESGFLEASFDSIAGKLGRDEEVLRHTPSIFPLPPDASYYYSSGFGYRIHPFTGRREFHNGLDIAGHRGTDILATADGVVEKVARDRRLGIYVAIDHGFGYRTLYGHLRRRPPLQEGQEVKRGDVIGEMGNTGRSTGPHLHYSVFKGRRARNPLNYFADRRGLASIF